MTSHDVVAAIRRAARVRRVGHAGTLDPLATGVLLVCIDQATRVSRYLVASDKEYRARICLGQTTDTDDSEGQITQQRPLPPDLNKTEIKEALAGFVGELYQVPPRYAAIKQNGVPLYKLARQGIDTKPATRRVTIHSINLLEWHKPYLTIDVRCGPGTYIRALARDLGAYLGCGGHLSGLVRSKSGQFFLDKALELTEAVQLLKKGQKERIANILWPLDAALIGISRFTINSDAETRLGHGQQIDGPSPGLDESQPILRTVYAEDGTLIAIARYDKSSGLWQPDTVFNLRPTDGVQA